MSHVLTAYRSKVTDIASVLDYAAIRRILGSTELGKDAPASSSSCLRSLADFAPHSLF